MGMGARGCSIVEPTEATGARVSIAARGGGARGETAGAAGRGEGVRGRGGPVVWLSMRLQRKRTVSRVVTGIRIWATQPMDGQRA